MPELPEVETVARELHKSLVGKKITKTIVRVPKMVLPHTTDSFNLNLKNKVIEKVSRRAKIVIISLNTNKFLLVHLKMTGQLIYKPASGKLVIGGHPQPGGGNDLPNKFTHIEFHFTDKSVLYFNDMRKFGWIKLVTETEKDLLLSGHGVEPLSKSFTVNIFTDLLTKYPNRNLKISLLDQKLVAGLGNIYVDEACFNAKILPTRIISTLTKTGIKKLHQEIVAVLKLSIKKKGTSAKNYVRPDGTKGGFVPYLNVYGRAGASCKKCKTPITKIKFAGRGTHFCSKCQK